VLAAARARRKSGGLTTAYSSQWQVTPPHNREYIKAAAGLDHAERGIEPRLCKSSVNGGAR